ncbi:MAG TPA: lipopolysaccharide kinase InaA family protein, partial [Actinomycetota bacterium]|nr:lipopolysaccharide kinase InaA family protein [Actinomycetota bacterium]
MQIVARTGHPDFLDLPWQLPLEEWHSERLVTVPAGIHRHVVRFVAYDGALYALKEMPQRLADREYRLLRALDEESMPVVEAVGVVSGRGEGEQRRGLGAVLITRHLEFSLPFRTLFTGHGVPDLRNSLLDALVQLLVRLHLVGFFWGDCSLSNTLFRRDAGALAAYLVDAETGEMHPTLSHGQREHDVTMAEENIAGDLLDLEAAGRLPEGLDPIETA